VFIGASDLVVSFPKNTELYNEYEGEELSVK